MLRDYYITYLKEHEVLHKTVQARSIEMALCQFKAITPELEIEILRISLSKNHFTY